MKETELKPCPFCGGKAELSNYTHYWIGCKDCWVETKCYKSKEEAIEAWNRRV